MTTSTSPITVDPSPRDAERRSSLPPVLTPLLRRRAVSLTLGIVGVAQLAVAFRRITWMPCPLLGTTGIPCPGCGMSRACVALLKGDISDSLHIHAAAPFLIAAIILLLAGGLFPPRPRAWLVARLGELEQTTHLPGLLVICVVLYWLGRLLYAPLDFSRLMRS